MNFSKIIFFIIIFLITKNAMVQDKLGSIVVTPNRSLVELNKVGSSVLMINKRQIESSAATTTSGVFLFGG